MQKLSAAKLEICLHDSEILVTVCSTVLIFFLEQTGARAADAAFSLKEDME